MERKRPDMMELQTDIRSLASINSLLAVVKSTIAPHHKDERVRNREVVLNVLLVSTLIVLGAALLLLLVSYLGLHNYYVWPRIVGFAAITAFTGAIYGLAHKEHYWTAASLLMATYFVLSAGMVFHWGASISIGILMFGTTVVLAGILLGAKYSVYAAVASAAVLIGVETAASRHWIHPNLYWRSRPSDLGEVLGFCLVFIVLAVSSWLFNRQMERSLRQAIRAEAALQRQKVLLEMKVEERTSELQAMQLEKVQQLYHFAELGQMSTAVLHDIANHLSVLTLNLEELKSEDRSLIMQRALRSIYYMDEMVQHVQAQLHGDKPMKSFSIASEMKQVLNILRFKARPAQVALEWLPDDMIKKARYHGDATRFRQLMTNVISNAIDAYDGVETDKRSVLVTAKQAGDVMTFTVTDHGKGISAEERERIFKPFYSTKHSGIGIGLYLSRQIAEEYFNGSITIEPTFERTTFVITIAKAKK